MTRRLYSLILALALTTAYVVAQSYPQGQGQTPPPAGIPDASQGSQRPGDPNTTATPSTDAAAADRARQDQIDAENKRMKEQKEALKTQVRTKFSSDPAFAQVKADVKDNGEVKLKGKVASEADRSRAEQMAQSVPGVSKVKNKIKVDASLASTTTAPASAGATTTPSASGENQASTPEGSASSSTTAQGSATAQTQTATPPASTGTGVGATGSTSGTTSAGSSTGATTPSTGVGSTTASGTGSTSDQSSGSALPQSSGLPQSDTETSASAESSSLQKQIDAALKKEPTLANSSVNVVVNDSSIQLSGSVVTGKEKQTAKRIAQSFAGNRRVDDRITVTGRGSSSTTSPDSSVSPSGTSTPTTPEQKETTPRSNPQTQGDQSPTPR